MTSTAPTVLILCGGSGERLGGIDKPLRPVAGRPLIEHVLAALAPAPGKLVISANRHADSYRHYAAAVVDDGCYSGCGPLAGIAAGLVAAGTDTVLCVPGDAPALPPDLLQRLAAARDHDSREVAVVHDGSGLQPLCLLLPRSALISLTAFLDRGERAAHRWIGSLRPAVADCSDWPRWGWSLNTAAEWNEAEQRMNHQLLP